MVSRACYLISNPICSLRLKWKICWNIYLVSHGLPVSLHMNLVYDIEQTQQKIIVHMM